MYLQDKEQSSIPLTPEIFQEKFGVVYLNNVVFQKDSIREKIVKRSTKKLRLSHYKEANHWNLCLLGEERRHGPPKDLLLRDVNPLVGYGVYATKKFLPYTYIGEYTGVVRRRKWRKDRSNDYIFGYAIGSHKTPWIIDAKEQGNLTRFINHSYEPNLLSSWIVDQGIAHIIFFTKRHIEVGEQLTYDYGPRFWAKKSQPMTL